MPEGLLWLSVRKKYKDRTREEKVVYQTFKCQGGRQLVPDLALACQASA